MTVRAQIREREGVSGKIPVDWLPKTVLAQKSKKGLSHVSEHSQLASPDMAADKRDFCLSRIVPRTVLGRKSKKGLSHVSIIAGLALIGALLGFVARVGEELRVSSIATSYAHYLNLAARGAQNYLDANTTILAGQITDETPYIVVTPTGVEDANGNQVSFTGEAGHGLRDYFPASVKKTRFNQDIRLYVYKGADGTVHGLVATNGGVPETEAEKSDARIRYMNIAHKVSGMNGFGVAMSKDASGAAIDPGVQGVSGDWVFPFDDSDHGSIPAFPDGQLARPLYAFTTSGRDDVLYRTEIDGRDELNAMRTDLHMNGWQITDAGTIRISQKPTLVGTDESETANVPASGNGLVIEPYVISNDADIATAADTICSHADSDADPEKPDGFMFTISRETAGDVAAGVNYAANDLNGLWMCMNGRARLFSDSVNSSPVKVLAIVKHGDGIQKPKCPAGSTPAIYLSVASFGSDKNNPVPVAAYQAVATDSGNSWNVQVRLKSEADTGENWTSMSEAGKQYLNYAVAQTFCRREYTSPVTP